MIAVQDIWDAIPDEIRTKAKLTHDKIYRGSCLQFYHEHEEEEVRAKEARLKDVDSKPNPRPYHECDALENASAIG